MKKALAIIVTATLCTSVCYAGHHRDSLEVIAKRLAPVGQVNIIGQKKKTEAKPAQVARAPMPPKELYDMRCKACHASGAAGAPKISDKAAWEARSKKGLAKLTANAIKGINAMSPKGGCVTCTDDEIGATVKYMLKQAGIKAK